MQDNLQDYVLEATDILVFPLVRQELELLYDNPVAFSSYLNVWYDGVDLKKDSSVIKQINAVKSNEDNWLWHTMWVVVSVKDRTIIGGINYKGAPQDQKVSLECNLNEKYHNKGFGSKAVMLFNEWAIKNGVKTLQAKTLKDNIAANRVLQKNGYKVSKKTAKYNYYEFDSVEFKEEN